MEQSCIYHKVVYGTKLCMEQSCIWKEVAYGTKLHVEQSCIVDNPACIGFVVAVITYLFRLIQCLPKCS
jgi:hypothetical protein